MLWIFNVLKDIDRFENLTTLVVPERRNLKTRGKGMSFFFLRSLSGHLQHESNTCSNLFFGCTCHVLCGQTYLSL